MFVVYSEATKGCLASGGRIVFFKNKARKFETLKAAEAAARKFNKEMGADGTTGLEFTATPIEAALDYTDF